MELPLTALAVSECELCEDQGMRTCVVHKVLYNRDWWRALKPFDDASSPCSCVPGNTPPPSTHLRACNCRYHRDDLS